MNTAILIASHNGEATITKTVLSAKSQGDVYVVSDASTDTTGRLALRAGACVMELPQNVGKPTALKRAIDKFGLTKRYDTIAILDDDTTIAPDFIEEALKLMTPGTAIVVGKTLTNWKQDKKWNCWLGLRAYSYWRYQLLYRKIQSKINVMNCISGSNSIYRSELLDQVLVEKTPYIVDDTYWVLETHRQALGKIVYAPKAKAWICDPTSMKDWYKQNLRWLWGSMQGIWGHEVGRHATRFDFFYLGLILDWFTYVLGMPALMVILILMGRVHLVQMISFILLFSIMPIAGAVALKKWRLIPMIPFFIGADVIYRVVFIHALIKTFRQPRVESCRWESPTRYSTTESR